MALIRGNDPLGTFERAPIALVAGQLHFEPILRLTETDYIAPLQDALREQYPVVNRVAGLQVVFAGGGLRANPLEESAGWAFVSSDQLWQITVGRDNLAIQTQRYASYEELRDRFLRALQTFVDLFTPGARTRLGLRYVNRLMLDDIETVEGWRDVVRPELLGLAALPDLVSPDEVKHSFAQARFAAEDSQMVVRYGVLEAGTGVHPDLPAADTEHFLLDMDEFDVRRFDTIDLREVERTLDAFHGDIHRLFRRTLTDEGVRRLGITASAGNAERALQS